MTSGRLFFLWIMMLSTGARAFVSSRIQHGFARSLTATRVTRAMTTGSSETSVVDTCLKKIQDALESTDVKVTGAYDDPNGSHISIEVVSAKFAGKRPVQRQQLVYKAIWEELQGPVHAVDSMICKTPEEV
jgi:stress-induced morphogen